MSFSTAKNGIIAYTLAAGVGGFVDSFFPSEQSVNDGNALQTLTEVVVQAGITAVAAATVTDFMFRKFSDRGDETANLALLSGFIHSQRNLGRRTVGLISYLKHKATTTGFSFNGSIFGPATTEITASKVVRTPMTQTVATL